MKLFILFALVGVVLSSPLDDADKYVKGYRDGIEELKRYAHEFHPKERSFIEEYKDREVKPDPYEFDFIIIGGGTAGSVLASRLSEVPEYKVLLLEAGGEESKITTIPGMAENMQKGGHTWGYKTEPQETWCLGNEHKECDVPTGKMLGGSSAINDMIYTRGNARDYDIWSDLGHKGWCSTDTAKYFKKAEDYHLSHFDRKFHNLGGPMCIEPPHYESNLTHHFLEAGTELGYKIVDYNGKEQLGFAPTQLYTKNGERHSTYQGYIKHNLHRKNLIVRPKSQVIEILISPHTKDAYGVKYVSGDFYIVSKASKEVIITAGAINSAQLLMLSGIGPKEILEKHNIECIENLPVGKYLKDHPVFTGVEYFFNHTHEDYHMEHDYDHEENLIKYLKYGKGPLSTPATEALAFLKTEASKESAKYPDVYFSFRPNPHEHKFSVYVAVAHPKSHGSVSIKTKDPLHFPTIHLNHYSDEDEHDIQTMLAGIRLAHKLCATKAFEHAHLNEHTVEGCTDKYDSDDYWHCAIRHMTISAGDYSGTCKMGTEPEHSVVDNELRVHGIHKLRVADASVIPVSITGHIEAANIMIAEKAADMIKYDWK